MGLLTLETKSETVTDPELPYPGEITSALRMKNHPARKRLLPETEWEYPSLPADLFNGSLVVNIHSNRISACRFVVS